MISENYENKNAPGGEAEITKREAFLFTNFGVQMAVEYFGQVVINKIPVYSRGKHKGKPKGLITWLKVERSGWTRSPDGNDRIYETRVGKVIAVRLFERDFHTKRVLAIHAEWREELKGKGES